MEFMSDAVSGDDMYRPSLFELVAQDQLRDLMQPAMRYVLSIMAQRHPRYLLRIFNRFDEVYSMIMLLIERYYLKEWGSSFAENFYGLKRRRTPVVPFQRLKAAVKVPEEYERLHGRQRRWSLFVLIGLPYIANKAHQAWEKSGGGLAEDLLEDDALEFEPRQSPRMQFYRRCKNLYRRAYPYANIAWNTYLLVYQISYLFEKTRYYRPWLKFMRVEVRRMSGQDHAEGMQRTLERILPKVNRPFGLKTLPAYTLALIRKTPQIAFEGVKYLLPLSIFFFKFLEWWYNSDHYRSSLQNGQLALGPPKIIAPHPKGTSLPAQYGHCPICDNPFNNPTALPSGYCFCYTCAFNHVSLHGSCPISKMVCTTDQLRKVMV